ncbi:MAG TPA: peptidylprolyl isomerase [Parafilimonas sp.]|nr:peptidylprolyl isomerase [Parafilimonas sp.]
MRKFALTALSFILIFTLSAQTKKTTSPAKPKTTTAVTGRLVEIKTDYGTMIVKLYDSTPLHRDNFIKLVKEKFYDSLLFHRVIQNFMIQGGDPQSKDADSTAMLGDGEAPGEMIPAEFRSNLYHKKGALAMARTENPEKASSNCQFYIVQGQPYANAQLNDMECKLRQNDPEFYFTDAERKTYNTIGGTPFLDQNYTVFGEVIKGLDVIDKIAVVQTDQNDRPVSNVRMKMRMLN